MSKTIVCYGDSNTFGADMSSPRGRFSMRWPLIMADELGSAYDIMEEGLNGRTAATDDTMMGNDLNGLRSLPERLDANAPIYLLIIMLGTNDVKEKYGLSPQQITENVGLLISLAEKSTVWQDDPRILLIAPTPLDEKIVSASRMGLAFGEGCVEKSKALAGLYKDLAESRACYLMDASEYITVGDIDYVHLSQDGHTGLGKAVAAFLRANEL